MRAVYHRQQLRPAEQRHRLARIEQKGNAGGRELLGVRAHAFLAVGRDDAQCNVADILNAILVRVIHRAWVERGDLVVVHVGDDECLRRIRAGNLADGAADAERRKAITIVAAVVADRRHDDRVAADAPQVVRDVACAATPFAAHLPDLERHGQDAQLIGRMCREKLSGNTMMVS